MANRFDPGQLIARIHVSHEGQGWSKGVEPISFWHFTHYFWCNVPGSHVQVVYSFQVLVSMMNRVNKILIDSVFINWHSHLLFCGWLTTAIAHPLILSSTSYSFFFDHGSNPSYPSVYTTIARKRPFICPKPHGLIDRFLSPNKNHPLTVPNLVFMPKNWLILVVPNLVFIPTKLTHLAG